MYGETFDVSVNNGKIICPIGQSIFAINLPLKLFVLPLQMLTLQVHQCLIWYVFEPHASEIWAKSYSPKYTKFGFFLDKNQVFKTIFANRWRHSASLFCSWKFFKGKLFQISDYYLLVFQLLSFFDTCNQVKSCTKHDGPDQYETLCQ